MPTRLEITARKTVRISVTFPMPPISKTKVPVGLRADLMPVKKSLRVDSGRRIHCEGDVRASQIEHSLLKNELEKKLQKGEIRNWDTRRREHQNSHA
jgi:hypothetical protein